VEQQTAPPFPMPLCETSAALRAGKTPLTDHVREACDRIEREDPHILALLPEPNRRARLLEEAAALERRYPEIDRRPPLYGALVGVKDIFRVDGFATAAGSALPPALFEGPEAVCVGRLREAGALILGKTVTTEFAMMEPGATRNPHNRDHTPGGSSSGSAAAVAAGFATLALGSQTIGSVIRPAAYCGVAGFKPSFDRISTEGMLHCSPSLDHVGFFTQDAAGTTLAASVLLEGWRTDSCAAQANRTPTVGVPDGPYLQQTEPAARRAFEGHVARLEQAGCHVRRLSALGDIKAIAARHMWLAFSEFAQMHDAWFKVYGSLYRPRSAALVELGREVPAEQLEAGRRSRLELRERLHGLMESNDIEAWATPSAPGPAPAGLSSTGDFAMNLPWTHAGLPTVTLPAGTAKNGLPLGVQLSARFMADEQLLAWAETLQPALAAGAGPAAPASEIP
jgi:Asp-tRNA(Asn)/Glu-tRNA(Gln) amidotransferase A subunit family amidase